MRHNHFLSLLISLGILILAFVSCQQPNNPASTATAPNGSTLTVKANTTALPPLGSLSVSPALSRTLTPAGINFSTPVFTLVLTGPVSQTLTNSTGLFSITNMANGNWTYTLTLTSSSDSSGTILGTASGSFTMPSGVVLTPVLTVPTSGTGTFSLSLGWPSTYALTPTVSLVGNTTINLTQTSSAANSFSYSASAIPPGNYTLTVNLALANAAEGVYSWGDIQSTYFYGGKTTSTVYGLTASDLNRPPTPTAPTVTWVETTYNMDFHPQIRVTSVPGATQYRIYRDGGQVCVTSATTWSDTTLNPTSTAHTYTVIAQNGFGDSLASPSSTVAFPTGPFYVSMGGSGPGTSTDQPLGDFQTAVDLAAKACALYANGRVRVNVAPGTYIPTGWPNGGSADRERHFALRNGVYVAGSGPGSTIFSGDLGVANVATDNAYHVFYQPNTCTDLVLTGCTVSDAYNNDASTEYRGSALFDVFSGVGTLCLTSCTFTNNYSAGDGGAVYIDCGSQANTATFSSVKFLHNSSSGGDGGALAAKNCCFLFYGNNSDEFTDNKTSSSVKDGGAIYLESTGGYIGNSTFTSNSSKASGGAVKFNTSCNVGLTQCSFLQNTTTNFGGAVIIDGGSTPVFTTCTFDGSDLTQAAAPNKGGAVYILGTTTNPRFTGCTFKNNKTVVGGNGGAVFIQNGTPAFTNCQFLANLSSFGGAVCMEDGASNSTFNNCTWDSNIAATNAGAVNISDNNSVDLQQFYDCTFTNNQAQNGGGGAVIIYKSSKGVFVRCQFVNNTATRTSATNHPFGGAIRTEAGAQAVCIASLFALNKSVELNGSPASGHAIYVGGTDGFGSGNGPSALTLIRCTVANNLAGGTDPTKEICVSSTAYPCLILLNILEDSTFIRSSDYCENSVTPHNIVKGSSDFISYTSPLPQGLKLQTPAISDISQFYLTAIFNSCYLHYGDGYESVYTDSTTGWNTGGTIPTSSIINLKTDLLNLTSTDYYFGAYNP